MASRSNRWSHICKIILPVVLVCLAVWSVNVAQAETLGLPYTGWPDMSTFNILINYGYDSGTNTGHLTAHAGYIDPILNNKYYVDNGTGDTYNLDVYVNSAGVLKTSPTSTISITGDMWNEDWSDYLVTGPTLLTGTLSQFGFSEAGAPLEFIFNVTGGNLKTSEYFPNMVGLLLHQPGYNGDWTQSFSATGAFSDLFNYVPEPSSWVLLSTFIIGGWMAYRRKRG